jgi:hypothetical protein
LFFDANARRLAIGRIHDHHVRRRNESLLFDDTTLLCTATAGLRVMLLHPHALDTHPRLRSVDGDHVPLFASVRTCDDLNQITRPDL